MKGVSTELWIAVAVIALGVGMYVLQRTGDVISGAEARALVKDGALLVDVRTREEFLGGHIDGALNIPLDQVPKRLREFGEHSDTIVVYCRSGQRSGMAKGILEKSGFSNVRNLGGMDRW